MATKAQMAKLDKLRVDMAKKFGDNAVMLATDMPSLKVCHSGSLALDFALGAGGVPRNRMIELIGEEGSGKTTLALLIIRQLLLGDSSRHAVFIDMEHKLTTEWAEKLIGSEAMSRLLYFSPDSAEQATDMYVEAVGTGTIQAVIFDSIGGAPTLASMEKSAEVGEYGGNAKAISRFSRIAANFSAKYECLTIGVNQMRVDMSSGPGQKINSPGGMAWRHACIARIMLRRGREKFEDKINGEIVTVGYDIKARVFKNQMAAPGRVASWNFFNLESQYGPVGIDTTEECIRLSEMVGVVDVQSGGYYAHAALEGGRVRGRARLRDAILADEKLKATIVSEVLAALSDDSSRIAEIAPITDIDLDMDEQALTHQAVQDRTSEPDLVGAGMRRGLPDPEDH